MMWKDLLLIYTSFSATKCSLVPFAAYACVFGGCPRTNGKHMLVWNQTDGQRMTRRNNRLVVWLLLHMLSWIWLWRRSPPPTIRLSKWNLRNISHACLRLWKTLKNLFSETHRTGWSQTHSFGFMWSSRCHFHPNIVLQGRESHAGYFSVSQWSFAVRSWQRAENGHKRLRCVGLVLV